MKLWKVRDLSILVHLGSSFFLSFFEVFCPPRSKKNSSVTFRTRPKSVPDIWEGCPSVTSDCPPDNISESPETGWVGTNPQKFRSSSPVGRTDRHREISLNAIDLFPRFSTLCVLKVCWAQNRFQWDAHLPSLSRLSCGTVRLMSKRYCRSVFNLLLLF